MGGLGVYKGRMACKGNDVVMDGWKLRPKVEIPTLTLAAWSIFMTKHKRDHSWSKTKQLRNKTLSLAVSFEKQYSLDSSGYHGKQRV